MARMMAENPVDNATREKHIKRDSVCFKRARERNQLTFTVVEQDVTAPKTIADWIRNNIMTASPAKLYEALEIALAMRESEVVKKNAD